MRKIADIFLYIAYYLSDKGKFMNKVQLIYNPYQEKSRIIINGNSISEYSQLANYLQESFEIWSSAILEAIGQELNDEFELEIVSDEFHSRLLKEMAERYGDCISVLEKSFLLNQSVLERFEKLKRFSKQESDDVSVRVLIFSKDRMLSAVIMGELCKSGNYSVQQSALYLGEGKIECIVSNDSALLEKEKYELVICVEQSEQEVFETLNFVNVYSDNIARMAGIRIENEICFMGLKEGIYYAGLDFQKLSETVTCFVEYLGIVPYIKKEKEYIEENGFIKSFESQKMQLEYLLIDAVEPVLVAYCEPEVEEGETIKLELITFPENAVLPEITVKVVNPSILRYADGRLYGILDGETDIEVSVSGSIQPIYRNHIRVKRVIRISNICIENSFVVLPEGAKYQIAYNYEPEDADNIDEIEYISTDENVARIIEKGQVACVHEGSCDIVIRAENVTAKCHICVKPEMKRIILPNKQIRLTMGQQVAFLPEYEPKNCFDTRIITEVEKTGIVDFREGKLISRGLGRTQLTFSNVEKTVKDTVEIVVESSLYASEKLNVYKIVSFIIAVASILLFAIKKAYGVIGVVIGVVIGILAIMKDCENVEGITNVRGEPMKPDYSGSILFIIINILIGILGIIR